MLFKTVASSGRMTPSAGPFKMLTGASVAYGFTDGGAQADEIALTDLGQRVVAPTEEGDDVLAMREALLRPRSSASFWRSTTARSYREMTSGAMCLSRWA